MQKILIDTDPGQDIDDLLALLFALLRPELDVQAITTVTWPTVDRARLVRRLLRHLDRADIPVSAGMDHPLRPLGAEATARLHDRGLSMNHAVFAEPEDPADAPDAVDAVDRIIHTVEASPGEVGLACLAPLTNLACALSRKPGIARLIPYVALMGGETHLNRVEHNVAFDAVAADIVLASGIPVFMGTWDVTRRLVLTQADCDRFRQSANPLHQAIGRAIDHWLPAQSWKPGPVMYDLFPVVWSYDRSFYSTAEMRVKVETRGEATQGMTVVCGSGSPIAVTTDIRAEALRACYLETVFGV